MKKVRDPFLDVIGIGADGKLCADLDAELYPDSDAPNKNCDGSPKLPATKSQKPKNSE